MKALFFDLTTPVFLPGGLSVNTLTFAVVLALLALALYAVKAPGIKGKIFSIVLVIFVMAVMAFSLVEQLSWPRELSSSWIESRGEKGIIIKYATVDPPKRIYLLVEIDNKPRFFWIKWSEETEKSLAGAMKETKNGREGGIRLRMRRQQNSLETIPEFYSNLWPAPPPKNELPPQEPPIRFQP